VCVCVYVFVFCVDVIRFIHVDGLLPAELALLADQRSCGSRLMNRRVQPLPRWITPLRLAGMCAMCSICIRCCLTDHLMWWMIDRRCTWFGPATSKAPAVLAAIEERRSLLLRHLVLVMVQRRGVT